MSKENQDKAAQAPENFYESFMGELEKSTEEKVQTDFIEHVGRQWMNTPDINGSFYYCPVNAADGRLGTLLEGVREVNCKLSPDNQFPKWWKLLPKSIYNFVAGSQEEKLYDELVSIHEALLKKWQYKTVRWKTYYLSYVWIIKAFRTNGELMESNKALLLVFPTKSYRIALKSELQSKHVVAGSHVWMSSYYSREPERTAMVKMVVADSANGRTYSISHQKIDEESMGITDGNLKVAIPEEALELMQDPLVTFMNRNSVDDFFDVDTYTKLKYVWLGMLDDAEALKFTQEGEDNVIEATEVKTEATAEVKTEKVEEVKEAPKTEKVAEATPEKAAETPQGPEDDLPF